ncbi:MAG: hypothetical protein ACOCV1_06980 [Bacillota bacterium]
MSNEFDFEGNWKNVNKVEIRLKERKENSSEIIKELYNLLLINDCAIVESCLMEIEFNGEENHPKFKELDKNYKKLRNEFYKLGGDSMSFDALSAAKYLDEYVEKIIYSEDREKVIPEIEEALTEKIKYNNNKLEDDREYYEEFPEHYYNNEEKIERKENEITKIIDGSYYLLDLIDKLKKEEKNY